ncbi:MAG: mechanosensitive ion channel family protein, partial [Candidatus Electrothrix sp. AUS1_2]|nr:mechanosensitive ion channel family protein [Candidatus Electrothrix sp. AUS1_2]
WDVNLTPLFASAGIVGIAISLGAKDTLSNFFSGIALLIDKSFKVGDYIILDKDNKGEVIAIGIRSTKIKTGNDIIIIPNSIISTKKIITNQSTFESNYRIDNDISVSYGNNLYIVEQILLYVATKNTALAENPVPQVQMLRFDKSAINLRLLVWVQDSTQIELQRHNLIKSIHIEFREQGIKMPEFV